MSWFTLEELQQLYPHYKKVQDAPSQFVKDVVIPKSEDFVLGFIGGSAKTWTLAETPAEVIRVAKNYAVNRILADDENVKIAQARGQPSFMVAGDQINLDLSPGRNPLLSPEDEAILIEEKENQDNTISAELRRP